MIEGAGVDVDNTMTVGQFFLKKIFSFTIDSVTSSDETAHFHYRRAKPMMMRCFSLVVMKLLRVSMGINSV